MSGLMQSGILSGVALGAVALPGSYPHYLSMVQALGIGPVLIFSTKFVLAFPIVYHFWNGFRHLAWDMGHGFKIAELYKVQIFSLSFPFKSFEIYELFSVWLLCGGFVSPVRPGPVRSLDQEAHPFYNIQSLNNPDSVSLLSRLKFSSN